MLLRRTERMCNFVEWNAHGQDPSLIVYRQYATLYFVAWADHSESALALLDLIQLYVEALDRLFQSVCELDIIFHPDVCHALLVEVIQGGLVMETDQSRILTAYHEQLELIKQEDPLRASVDALWNQLKRSITSS